MYSSYYAFEVYKGIKHRKSNVGNADLYEWNVYKVQCHNRALLDTYKNANNY